MQRFCSLLDDPLCDFGNNAITGSGAFRRFKDFIFQYGIQDDWYHYKSIALREIANDWCEEHKINYV